MEERVPEIRFKGFEEEWTQQRLGDIAKLNGRIGFRGYTEKDIVSKEDGGILAFSPTNIVDNVINLNCKNTYITRSKFEESPEIQIHNGDIIFVKTGSTLGKSALISNLSEEATLNPQVVVLRVKNNEQFFASLMTTKDVMDQINSSKIGGAVPTLTETRIKDFSISIPISNNEKNNLGNLFHSMDTLITLQQQKLDKLKTFKKSCLEKMFPKDGKTVPEVRFKGFEGPWERKTLGDLMSLGNGRDYKHLQYGSVPVYGTGGYMTSVNDSLCDKDSIGIGRKGTIDKPYILKAPFWTVDTLFYATPKEGVDLYYLFGLFQIIDWKSKDESTGVPSLSKQNINGIETYSSSNILEQRKIGIFFNKLDNDIELLHQKLDKLKFLKQACLEKMFV